MKTKTICSLFVLLMCVPAWAQLSIETCYRKAQANYPLIQRYGLIEKTEAYNLSNAAKGYLPQISFSAQASYQSDVTKIPFDPAELGFEGIEIPSVSQDQYKATLDVNQAIWDGGMVRSEKQVHRTQAEVERKDLDVSLYAINDRVNQLFFGILLADAQIKQNQVLQAELERHCAQVSSYIENGVANQSDLDALRVDLLQAKQQEAQYAHTKRAYVSMLSKLIGKEIREKTEFVRPEVVRPLVGRNNRPELALYEAQIQNLKAQDARIRAGLMPRLGLFVTGGYGKPGLDMLENDFKAYYLAGVKLSWNIGNFWTKKNDQAKIQTSIRSIEAARETFIFNTDLDIAQRNSTIDTYFEQLKYDDEIIALHASVRRASEAKMANGTLSGTDLTRDIHAEQSAIQNKILHEMELLLAIYNLKYVTNE